MLSDHPYSRFMLVLITAGAVAACSNSLSQKGFSPSFTGTSASPRVWDGVGTPPKRSGRHKLGSPYVVAGRTYVPRHEPDYDKVGIASWYGDDFHGRLTANGEIYDMRRFTAAHPTLPLPSLVRVTNLENGQSLVVRVNDRGPFVKDRIIDLSKAAAHKIGMQKAGVVPVTVAVLP